MGEPSLLSGDVVLSFVSSECKRVSGPLGAADSVGGTCDKQTRVLFTQQDIQHIKIQDKVLSNTAHG